MKLDCGHFYDHRVGAWASSAPDTVIAVGVKPPDKCPKCAKAETGPLAEGVSRAGRDPRSPAGVYPGDGERQPSPSASVCSCPWGASGSHRADCPCNETGPQASEEER